MINREEFESFKMKTEVWQAEYAQRMRAVEAAEQKRSERDLVIIESLARLETTQGLLVEQLKDYQEKMATAFEKLTDKLTDHMIDSERKKAKGV